MKFYVEYFVIAASLSSMNMRTVRKFM